MISKTRLLLLSLFIFINVSSGFCTWPASNTTVISDATGKLFRAPSIAINNSGYAVAGWDVQDVGGNDFVVVGISNDFGATWPMVSTLDIFNPDSGSNTRPRVALDSSNHAIVTWHRWVPGYWEVKVATFGISPTVITLLDPNVSTAPGRPEIAMDNSGHAIIIWQFYDGVTSYFPKVARSSDFGATWTTATTLDSSNPSDNEIYAQIAMDNAGNVIIAWSYRTGGSYYTRIARSSDFGATWSDFTTLDQANPSSERTFPQISMDNSGNAVLAWMFRTGGSRFTKTAKSSDFGATWSSITQLDSLFPSAENIFPTITMDTSGNAIVTWNYRTVVSRFVKTAKSSDFGANWSSVTTLDPSNPASSQMFTQVEMDDFGNAIIVWDHDTGAGNIWQVKRANSSDYGATWSVGTLDPSVILNGLAGNLRPELALDKSGDQNAVNAIAIWPYIDSGTLSSIETKHFQQITLPVVGKSEKLKEFLQIGLRNNVSAGPIGQQGTYKIYLDLGLTQLLQSVSNSHQVAQLLDDNVLIGSTNTYYITWTDAFGNVTGPVVVNISD